MQKIYPCLWFDNQAEEAVNFYVSIFDNSKINEINYYDEESSKAANRPEESVMTISFKLEGQDFLALNGGPAFSFSQAISFVVDCKSQDEVDRLWHALSAGGQEQQCGWLIDKFGLAWQIVPTILTEMINDPDKEKAKKVMKSMLGMIKINIEELQKAYNS